VIPKYDDTTNTGNTYKSNPSYYVGGGSDDGNNIEIDAGVAYEYKTHQSIAPGWSIFARVSKGLVSIPTNLRYLNPPNGWRCNSTNNSGVTSFLLTWTSDVTNNVGYLDVNPLGGTQPQCNTTNGYPVVNGRLYAAEGQPIFDVTSSLFVKRVIAMTQASPLPGYVSYALDGSYMVGCRASSCQVATNSPTVDGTTNPVWVNWSTIASYIDQTKTGYSTADKDRKIPGTNRNATGSHFIITFPDSALQGHRDDASIISRYDNEGVDIYLELAKSVKGQELKQKSKY